MKASGFEGAKSDCQKYPISTEMKTPFTFFKETKIGSYINDIKSFETSLLQTKV